MGKFLLKNLLNVIDLKFRELQDLELLGNLYLCTLLLNLVLQSF